MKIINQRKINIRVAGHIYAVVLQEWEGDREYVVRVPAFPEIVTQGASIIESKAMAKEAIELAWNATKNNFMGIIPILKAKDLLRLLLRRVWVNLIGRFPQICPKGLDINC